MWQIKQVEEFCIHLLEMLRLISFVEGHNYYLKIVWHRVTLRDISCLIRIQRNLHSEMTLTALGAAEMIAASGGKVTGVHFNLVSPFYSEATANNVFGAIGATIKYFPPNLADSAGAFATFTPVTAPIYGTLGILTLEHFHSYEVYQPH